MHKTSPNIEMLRVQALSTLRMPHHFLEFEGFAPMQNKLDTYCCSKQEIHNDDFIDFSGFAPIPEKLDTYCCTKNQTHNNAEENFKEKEFSFACTDVQGTSVFADEIFENGKIRSILLNFDKSIFLLNASNNDTSNLRPPLKKIFIEMSENSNSRSSDISKEPHKEPLKNRIMVEVKISNECYEKSNSTGSSKLWRFRQNINLRSNSDHKDAFVLLNPSVPSMVNKPKVQKIVVKKKKDDINKSTLSAYEKFYVMNKMRKDNNKRRSFLPYKHYLFGIFTNMNGLSRNLHPF
ncbi:uncharacterized protein [Cicer arietinum]|uniref:Uncharacterized protein LOC101514199 n=1 Tax=Cicer arietinum TaxID=3827 RepID=A0A1S2YU35_CICAR|nr:uncharacterized protein LOC101514199 [Cicer arietinum]XP_004509949.1 uncharacterized protein LOC101514522 [Cicer arietinum]